MKAGRLKEILESVDDNADVVVGVWLDQCRDASAPTDIDSVEVTHFDDDGPENAAFEHPDTRASHVLIVTAQR